MVNKENLGKIIKQKRREQKLTQKQLSEKAGLSRSYLADIENGRYAPSLETLVSIANILNLNLNEILLNTEIQDK